LKKHNKFDPDSHIHEINDEQKLEWFILLGI
jgi:hypothetical protein